MEHETHRRSLIATPTRNASASTELAMQAMAVEFPAVHGHPNRLPFEGVLTLVDVPSDKAPSGARGHRVILTRAAAQAALPSLLGMAVDYKSPQPAKRPGDPASAGWDGHDARQKCGIITDAELDGRKLRVAGFLFSKDFPEIEQRLAADAACRSSHPCHSERAPRANEESPHFAPSPQSCHPERSKQICHPAPERSEGQGSPHLFQGPTNGLMGMSYELADAHVADMAAPIWTLTRATFTGAAILLRDKAAYAGTSFSLSRRAAPDRLAAARQSELWG